MSMEIVKVDCIFPTMYVEVFGNGGYEVDKDKVQNVLRRHGMTTYDANIGGLINLIYSLNIEEEQKEYIIDILVSDEPDDMVMEFLRELKKKWKVIGFKDSSGFVLRLRINTDELARIKEVLEKEFNNYEL